MVECLLGAIGNLCANNENYKMVVYQKGTIEFLLSRLGEQVRAQDAWNIVEPSLTILRSLTNKNMNIPEFRNQVDFIKATNQLHELKPCLLLNQSPRSIVKLSLQIVRNLAQNSEHHKLLFEQQYVNQIKQITFHMCEELVSLIFFYFLTNIWTEKDTYVYKDKINLYQSHFKKLQL